MFDISCFPDFPQAQKLVGSALLVKDEDRPALEEGEFYTADLVGMKVFLKVCVPRLLRFIKGTGFFSLISVGAEWHLKGIFYICVLQETRELVGTVVNVFNSGASDLLHVELLPERNAKPRLEGSASGPLVWVPFVEAIVPNIDLSKREMLITPPKGLLELNIRADERSKKERRQLVSGFSYFSHFA